MAGVVVSDSEWENVLSSFAQNGLSGVSGGGMTAFYPYARAGLASGLEVWGIGGWGDGTVSSVWTDPNDATRMVDLSGDLSFGMGLLGVRGRLWSEGGAELSVTGDASRSSLEVTDGRGPGVAASLTRTRLAMEGRRVSSDGAWTSGIRAGGRVDGGDGVTDSALEGSGSVSHVSGRWETGLRGSWHDSDAVTGERGTWATLGLRPRDDGTGLSLALSPGLGTDASMHGRISWGAPSGAGGPMPECCAPGPGSRRAIRAARSGSG